MIAIPGMTLSLSISILLAAHPLAERVDLAGETGYRDLESWWPWSTEVPAPNDADELVRALERNGARLYLLNLTEGAVEFGGRGLAGVPSQEETFWANATAALQLAARAGTRYFNVLAGNVPAEGRSAGLATLERRLAELADRAAPLGIGLLIEQLNPIDHPDYLMGDPDEVVALLKRVAGRTSGEVGMLADTYHLAATDIVPAEFIGANVSAIRHVQLADFPGRGRPGSGAVEFDSVIAALPAAGYSGLLGLEFRPDGESLEPDRLWSELTKGRRMTP